MVLTVSAFALFFWTRRKEVSATAACAPPFALSPSNGAQYLLILSYLRWLLRSLKKATLSAAPEHLKVL
jgi:hypothetical protein